MSKRWKPEKGEKYWYVNILHEVQCGTWDNYSLERKLFNSGNCFKTKEEAKAVAGKFETLLLSSHEPVTSCNQLPKLTTEVFDRTDCPEWAKWAAVDEDGTAVLFDYQPETAPIGIWWERRAHHYCLISKRGGFDASDWKNSLVERPSKSLPRLTADVFNRTDCPEWAKYAAVDQGGNAFFHAEKPTINCCHWLCNYSGSMYLGKFDASDWQNSLIERPVKLPDWCMVDNICWHKRCGYFIVAYIDAVSKRVDIQQVDDRSKGYLSFHTVCNEVVQARFRPYKANELKALVGKSITLRDGSVCLCTAWSAQSNHILLDNKGWTAEKLLNAGYAIDDKPCGVFEHLNEKGEWVE